MDESPSQPLDRKFEELLQAYHDAMQRGDIEKAEAIGVECLVLASERAATEPSKDLQLKAEAHGYEAVADWQQAESAYRRALELAVTEKSDWAEFKAHHDLSSLHHLVGQEVDALSEAQAAVQAARRTGMVALLTMALESLTLSLLNSGDARSAQSAADESLRACGDDKMYDLQRARALVLRARCAVELNDTGAAEADLDVAWKILAPQPRAAMFAGVWSGLAGWWGATARLRTMQREYRGAVDAWRKAVELRRHVSQLPQLAGPYKFNSLAETLHRYGLALLAANEVDAAAQAFVESRAIQHSIGLPPSGTDPA